MLSRYVVKIPFEKDTSLLFSTRNAVTGRFDDSEMERISSTDYDILGADYDAFKRVGLVVRDHEGEYKEVKANFDLMNSSRTKANIYVLLNLACNLDCPYCFEKASKDGSFISERVTMAFVERVKADVIGKGTSVTMNFYGGEPMLSYGRMVRLSEEVREACAAGGVGYDAKMVSNGTLLDRAKAERLKQAGVRGVKLTLDGPEEVHDRMRPYKDGRKGSFKDTVRNAGEYADVLDVMVGGNYTRETHSRLPELLNFMADNGLPPEVVWAVKFDPVIDATGCAVGCASCGEDWVHAVSLGLRREVLERGYLTVPTMPVSCMMNLDSDCVVAPDGAVFKCPAMVGMEGMRAGDVFSKGLMSATQRNDAWVDEEGCRDCKYLPMCFGGCRFMSVLSHGGARKVDCRMGLFDATIPEMVRQDVLFRLMERFFERKTRERG